MASVGSERKITSQERNIGTTVDNTVKKSTQYALAMKKSNCMWRMIKGDNENERGWEKIGQSCHAFIMRL